MCGLCGFVALGTPSELARETLSRMVKTLRHRGPDEVRTCVGDGFAFAFTRLAIIDPVGGSQPMWSEDGTVVAMMAGEIYNHERLRAELRTKGHVFNSRCDAEVVPHLYEEYGVDFPARLDGQFAVAVYDLARDRFVAARDHFGVVPFFYAAREGGLVFGSEIKALLEHPLVEREVDPVGLDQVFTFPGLVSPFTMFRGIRSLPPGTRLVLSGAGRAPAEHRYWDLVYPKRGEIRPAGDEEFYRDQMEQHLLAAVERRLQSDVGIGVYLSGGLDSTFVAALIRHLRPGLELPSYAAAFAEKEISEADHQRAASRWLQTDHHERFIAGEEIQLRLPDVIRHTECPLKESFDAAALALSETVHRAGGRVVLTGQGADELLGGYIGYRFDRMRRSQGARIDARQLAEADLRRRLWGDENFFYERDDVAFTTVKQWLYADKLLQDEPDLDCLHHPVIDTAMLVGRDDLHRRSYLDLKLRLADHLLGDHGDRMAFANSVEARHPFLDRELAEFVATVPPELKLRGLQEKYLLKQVGRKWLPDEVVDREKFGFTAPGSQHLLRQRSSWVSSLLDRDRIVADGYFDPDAVADLVQRYREPGFRINVPFETDLLMTVITFNAFLDIFDMPRRGA